MPALPITRNLNKKSERKDKGTNGTVTVSVMHINKHFVKKNKIHKTVFLKKR